jgi:hypothetical protein
LFRQPPIIGQAVVTTDGQRFVMFRPVGADGPSGRELVVVENWLEELKAKMASK